MSFFTKIQSRKSYFDLNFPEIPAKKIVYSKSIITHFESIGFFLSNYILVLLGLGDVHLWLGPYDRISKVVLDN